MVRYHDGNMDTLHVQIEGIVFSEGGEIPRKTLMRLLQVDDAQLAEAVRIYNTLNRGLVLIADDEQVLMRPASMVVPYITALRTDEQNTPLSKASLEVLTIVLYKGRATASEVEYIRGVNSGYSLRHLTTRGLLLKSKEGSSYQYAPSAELLAHLGVTSIEALPDREGFLAQIHTFRDTYEDTH